MLPRYGLVTVGPALDILAAVRITYLPTEGRQGR